MQMCLAGAITLSALRAVVHGVALQVLPRRAAATAAWIVPRILAAAVVVLSVARATALVLNYGAPLDVYRHLPLVCPPYLSPR